MSTIDAIFMCYSRKNIQNWNFHAALGGSSQITRPQTPQNWVDKSQGETRDCISSAADKRTETSRLCETRQIKPFKIRLYVERERKREREREIAPTRSRLHAFQGCLFFCCLDFNKLLRQGRLPLRGSRVRDRQKLFCNFFKTFDNNFLESLLACSDGWRLFKKSREKFSNQNWKWQCQKRLHFLF